MPDKPTWYKRLDEAIRSFEALELPWIDRAMIETALNIRRRRAQQILKPLVRHTIGRNGLAHRDDVILRLRTLAAGDEASQERRRVERLRAVLAEARTTPRLLVETKKDFSEIGFASLPEGVEIRSGQITISFTAPQQALEKLLALAMAIGNDMAGFEEFAS